MERWVQSFRARLQRHRGKLAAAVLAMIIAPILAVGAANLVCESVSRERIFSNRQTVPYNDVALVLGTSKNAARGVPNLHFQARITAAASLYRAGKIRHLLVSGDNSTAKYDEPTDMRNALVEAGVPTNAITCDYAGFRTLDSVVRANAVFGLTNFTIVTEDFHCPRAVWIARQHGLAAIAFAAPDPASARWTMRVKAREALARVLCGLDLYVLGTQPKFNGPPEPIALAGHSRFHRS